MARPIVLSNGELHVGINKYGLVHDFYYPYVGLENHSAGKDLRHRVGVWVDGSVSWLDDEGAWDFEFKYPHHSLIGHTIARNESIGVILEFDDTVDFASTAFMRNIHVINDRSESRNIRLFMHQAFVIGDSRSNTDTAQYLPDSKAILHYRGRRAFVISGNYKGESFDQFTTGLFDIEGREGTYRDADDGELSGCAVEHGRVDSTIRFNLTVEGHSSERVDYWIAAGRSTREALFVHKRLQTDGTQSRFNETAHSWHKWLAPAEKIAEKLPEEYRQAFIRSVMIVKSHIDKRGAVIASTDTTMLNYSRDAYGYSWPRDGAYAIWPLIRMGYEAEAWRFFEFSRRGLHPSGYLMHKYASDGSLGSSWHPYVHNDDEVAPPIQEDETALVLFVFVQFYKLNPKQSLLTEFYESMIVPMADWMASYVDNHTGLPRESYDLWEEVFETTTYTTAVTYAALQGAAELADIAEDADRAVGWRAAADDMYAGAHKHLFNEERQAFRKGLSVRRGEIYYDNTIDSSSLFGAFMFGLFPVGSDELTAAVATYEERFSSDETIGVPRYEDDAYCRDDPSITGNYWFITTLWMSQYYSETGQLDKAKRIIDWTLDHSIYGGILSEQLSPTDLTPRSVAPLMWSHAELIATLLDSLSQSRQNDE